MGCINVYDTLQIPPSQLHISDVEGIKWTFSSNPLLLDRLAEQLKIPGSIHPWWIAQITRNRTCNLSSLALGSKTHHGALCVATRMTGGAVLYCDKYEFECQLISSIS